MRQRNYAPIISNTNFHLEKHHEKVSEQLPTGQLPTRTFATQTIANWTTAN